MCANAGGLDEIESISDMPLLFRLEARKSDQTGQLFLEFISYIGQTNAGEWVDIRITDTQLNEILKIVMSGEFLDNEK